MKFSPKSITLLLIVVAILFVGGGLAIGGFYEALRNRTLSVVEPTAEPTVNSEETNQEVMAQEETAAVLPDSFPEDFPVYENAILDGSWEASGEEVDGVSVVWKTQDEFTSVLSFYKAAFEEENWDVVSKFETDSSATFTFESGDTKGFVGITVEDGVVVISATIGLTQNES